MILAALAATAVLQRAPPAGFTQPVPPVARTPNVYKEPGGCQDIHREVIERQREELKKLGRLPSGAAQYAVERSVGGCGVPTPVGYHPRYLLPGAADPASKREDAPSNRR
jgi:hypothetical protein